VTPPILAGGSTSPTKMATAVNISGRGKFESSAQVFRFVYANVSGDFVMTARLDGVDFRGPRKQPGSRRSAAHPDFTQTATNFIYGGTMVVGDGSIAAHRSHRGRQFRHQQHHPGGRQRSALSQAHAHRQHVSGRHFAQRRFERHGGYATSAVRTFTAGLPQSLYVGFAVSSSKQHDHQRIRDVQRRAHSRPDGNEIIGPNTFTGDIGGRHSRWWWRRRRHPAAPGPVASR
jgi:hypothetical protein